MSHSTSPEAIRKQVKIYITVFAALAALTVLTVSVASFKLSVGAAVVVALFIATVKGSLVARYFMHLISEKKVIYLVLIIAFLLLLILMFITLGAYYDHTGGSVVP